MPATTTASWPEEPLPGPADPRPPSTRRRTRRPADLLGSLLLTRATRRRDAVPRQRLMDELSGCRRELTRWQQHADSYARELGVARRERAHLLAWLAALHPASAVITAAAGDGHEDIPCLRLVAGGWQLSWRIPQGDLALFAHVPYDDQAAGRPVRCADEAAERDARIRLHTYLLALEETLHGVPTGRWPPQHPARH